MHDPVRATESAVTSELDQLPDRDAEETAEWRASLDAVVRNAGPERAAYLLRRVHEYAARSGLVLPSLVSSDYINTVPASAQPPFPGDLALESRITALNRWNAAAMVTRGSRWGLGGHISTYASAAWLYEIGFHHFFRGKDADGSGDQLFLQGHASPGIYARVFLEGRLGERKLWRGLAVVRLSTVPRAGVQRHPSGLAQPWLRISWWTHDRATRRRLRCPGLDFGSGCCRCSAKVAGD